MMSSKLRSVLGTIFFATLACGVSLHTRPAISQDQGQQQPAPAEGDQTAPEQAAPADAGSGEPAAPAAEPAPDGSQAPPSAEPPPQDSAAPANEAPAADPASPPEGGAADVAPAQPEQPPAQAPAAPTEAVGAINASQVPIGAAVFGADGTKIGEINGVKSDESGNVQEILVTNGMPAGLNAKVFEITADKITSVSDGVKLSLSSEEAKQLPVIDNGNG
jgi:hypothetical protein